VHCIALQVISQFWRDAASTGGVAGQLMYRLKSIRKYQLWTCRSPSLEMFPLIDSAPEGIRTPNLLMYLLSPVESMVIH
jgi:hypothetical protein